MKKLLLTIAVISAYSLSSMAQNVLLVEDFQNGAPDGFNTGLPTGSDLDWLNYDGDGLIDGSSQSRPGEWFSGDYDIYDSLNIVAASNSWTNDPNPIQNWLITPPITITDASYFLYWKTCPYQTPLYTDGMHVLISKTGNIPEAFTDTVAVYAEYLSRIDPAPDSTFAYFTYSPGYVHGMDGTYVEYAGDSLRLRGALRPDSVSLASYVGQTIYVAFLASSHDDNLLFLDDVVIKKEGVNAVKTISANDFKVESFPNPATETTRVNFTITQFSRVTINLLDMNGRLVKKMEKGQLMTGNHFADIDLKDIPQGNYFIQVKSNNNSQAVKLTVVK